MVKKIFVKIKSKAKEESIEKIDESRFLVSVKAPAREGKANKEISKVLAGYFNVAVSRVHLVSGFSSKQKKFEIK